MKEIQKNLDQLEKDLKQHKDKLKLKIQLEKMKISDEFVEEVVVNLGHNKTILSYYNRLAKKRDILKIYNQSERLDNCNKFWLLDVYEKNKIKDFKKTSRCDDKFCNNCKLVKQAYRLSKFMPVIDFAKLDHELYHLVLTVPNIKSEELRTTIERMNKSFFELNRYFASKKKIKGIDFSDYGYVGAIRSLEITYNTRSYHPHFHCIIALKKDVVLPGSNVNKFSFTNKDKTKIRYFKDIEILIQKIWYLKFNNIKVTKKAIDNLDIGYSCIMDKVDENTAYEVFKYATKSNNEKGSLMTYKQFETLYDALANIRQIQGYGMFFGIGDEIDEKLLNEVEEEYQNFISKLKEVPYEAWQSPQELLDDVEYTLVSRNSIFKKLKQLKL